jgi:formylglycine-generating enzyme required for sulfatase activity
MLNLRIISPLVFVLSLLLFSSCEDKKKQADEQKVPIVAPKGMLWVEGKTFMKGAKENDPFAMKAEKPAHKVKVDGFFIDQNEVTNAQFKQFVEETGYITLAEKDIDWDEMKLDLPPNTPKPDDSLLLAGSLVFNKEVEHVHNLNHHHQWWTWKTGANWRHPQGPESTIEGMDDFPVVHIAYEDAIAYCNWANRRLPTEAEWEAAALGTQDNTIFTWGDDSSVLVENANTWQGNFPMLNNAADGFAYIAPVQSFPPNSIGLYDMLGNVWEMTNDIYNTDYYNTLDRTKVHENPVCAEKEMNFGEIQEEMIVIKGGSFLCHESYCASYRISARMANAKKSSSDHVGFRTVVTPEMIKE